MTKVTDKTVFDRCYGSTQFACQLLEAAVDLDGAHRPMNPDQVKTIRNTLREAYCAAQELKVRAGLATKTKLNNKVTK